MKTQPAKTNEKFPILQRHKSHEPGPNAIATIVDKRPRTVYQRQLRQTMEAHAAAKVIPLQRKAASGSSRFRQIASDMGAQYGVDTSGLKATHHSSFPAKLHAEATIQGNNIHFAPGKDTDYNMRHEVAHAIDNTLHGIPKGDTIVNGQKVDTTREKVVDQMASRRYLSENRSMRHKPDQVDRELFQLKRLAKKIDPNKLNVVGEDHGDSDKRRSLEESYTERRFGANRYWQEYEFSIPYPGSSARMAGDDFYLRFIYALFASLKYWHDSEKVYSYLRTAIHDYKRQDEFVWNYLKKTENNENFSMGEYLVDIITMVLKEIKKNPYSKKQKLEILKDPILKYLTFDQNITAYSAWTKKGEEAVLKHPYELARLNKRKEGQASFARSEWMHYVAEKATSKKGIWKIGNDHVLDIEDYLWEADYNLLDKKTFTRILSKYKKSALLLHELLGDF